MCTLRAVIIVALKTGKSFKSYCTCCPYELLRTAHRKGMISNQLPDNATNLHRRSLIVLLVTHAQVSGVDTTALLEKIADGEWAFVIHNTFRFIDELIAKLRDQCLYRNLVYRTIGWDA